MKLNREGQSAIISNEEREKIRGALEQPYLTIFDIATYTGERWGAILQLKQENVYVHTNKPRESILFSAHTRKKVSSTQSQTREVYIHPRLKESLRAYPVPLSSWMFPAPRDPTRPLSMKLADLHLKAILKRLKLDKKGISTHSTRRTFITTLAREGTPIKEIQTLTGHSSMEVVARYIESDPNIQKKAILLLT
jgi:integrase/recombinase XerD